MGWFSPAAPPLPRRSIPIRSNVNNIFFLTFSSTLTRRSRRILGSSCLSLSVSDCLACIHLPAYLYLPVLPVCICLSPFWSGHFFLKSLTKHLDHRSSRSSIFLLHFLYKINNHSESDLNFIIPVWKSPISWSRDLIQDAVRDKAYVQLLVGPW